MDGVSILSLVVALVDLSKFCFHFIQTAKEIHRAKDGLSKDIELEIFTHNMTECIDEIKSNPTRSNDSILADLCCQMEDIAKELLHKLAERTQPGRTTLRQILKVVVDELMHPKQLEELDKKLRDIFYQVQTRYVLLQSNQSIKMSQETATKTKELGASITQVYDMLKAFAEECRASRDDQQVQIVQRIEASTSTILADGLVTRNQMRAFKDKVVDEIRHNNRRQHDRNQFDHHVSKGYRRSVSDNRSLFRRRRGICYECGMLGHWASTCRREDLTCSRCRYCPLLLPQGD